MSILGFVEQFYFCYYNFKLSQDFLEVEIRVIPETDILIFPDIFYLTGLRQNRHTRKIPKWI
jgi:hypothetical protein